MRHTGRADKVWVLVVELEGLDQAESLIDAGCQGQRGLPAANREIVDSDLTEGSLGVDDEEAAEGDAGISAILEEDLVVPGHLLLQIGDKRNVRLAKTALVAGALSPGQVGMLVVDRDGNNLSANGTELRQAIIEGNDLCGANEGEVSGVEEENKVFALEII